MYGMCIGQGDPAPTMDGPLFSTHCRGGVSPPARYIQFLRHGGAQRPRPTKSCEKLVTKTLHTLVLFFIAQFLRICYNICIR